MTSCTKSACLKLNPTSSGAYAVRKWESPKKENTRRADTTEKRLELISYTSIPESTTKHTPSPTAATAELHPSMEISAQNQYWNPMFPDVLLPVLHKISSRTMDRFLSGRRLEAEDVSDVSLVGLRILYPSIELPSIDCLLKIDPEKYKQHHDWRAIKYKTPQQHLHMIRVEASIKESIQLEPACVALLGAEHFREHMTPEEYYRNLKTCTYAFLIAQTGCYMPVKQDLAEALMVHPVLMHTDNDRVRDLIFGRALLKRKYEFQGRCCVFFLPAFPFWVTPKWFEEWLVRNGSLKDRIHGKPEQHKPMDSDTQELLSSTEHAEEKSNSSSSSSQSTEDQQQQQRQPVRSAVANMSKINDDAPLNDDGYSDEEEEDEDEGEDEQYEKESRKSTPVNAYKTGAAKARGVNDDEDDSSSDSSSGSGSSSDDDAMGSGSDSESDREDAQQPKQKLLNEADVSGLKALANNISSVVKPGTFASGRASASTSAQKPDGKATATKAPAPAPPTVEEDDDEKPLPKPSKAQAPAPASRTPASGKSTSAAVSNNSAKKAPEEPIPKFQKKVKPTRNLLDDDSDEFDENADESVVVSNTSNEGECGADGTQQRQQHDSVGGSVVRAGYLPLGAGKRLIDFANKKHDKQQKRKDSKSSGKAKSATEKSAASVNDTDSEKKSQAVDAGKKSAPASGSSGAKIYLEALGPDYLLEFDAQPKSVKRPNSNKETVEPAMREAYNEYIKALHQWKDRAEAAVTAERKRIKKTDRAGYRANKKYIELNSKVRGIVVSKIEHPSTAESAPADTTETRAAPPVKSAASTAGTKRKTPDVRESESPSKGQKIKSEDAASDSAAVAASAAGSTGAAHAAKVKTERKRNQSVAAQDASDPLPDWVQPWRDVYEMIDGALVTNVANSRNFATNHPDAYKQNYATYSLSMNRSDATNVIGDIVMFAAANADRIVSAHTHAPVPSVEKGSRLRTMASVLHNTVAEILGLQHAMAPGEEQVKTEVEMEDLM